MEKAAAKQANLEKSLREHEHVLDTHLMARVCKQTDAIELKQKEEFGKLEANMQHFVSQYARGTQKLHDLVHSNIQVSQRVPQKAMKAHITKEMTKSQAGVFGHIDSQAEVATEKVTQRLHDLNIQAKDDSTYERLLRSLKYPTMNERRNHLVDSYEGTFKWVFGQYELSDYLKDEVYKYDKDNRDPPWDNFENCLKSDSDIYWISGKPGSGKSTLMKFLITNPLTTEALQIWHPEVVIISHFFWKPGSMIQRNVKGLFASLLYQLLAINQDLLPLILASSRNLEEKDSITDWSVMELQRLCLSTIRRYRSSICVFLDGLDEICDDDGASVLMEKLNTIKMIPNVGVCVASRPEQRFQLYLSQIPQLKLHDLTSTDMRRFADQTSRPVWECRQDLHLSVLDETVLPVLVSKAQGVFLWTRLAVKSLINGLEDGDFRANLVSRLEELPTELSQMYADMWKRLNNNTKVHRESTAKFLNLIIAHQEVQADKVLGGRWDRPTFVIDLVGATDLHIQTMLFMYGQKPTTEAAINSCIQIQGLIRTKCTGLVDVGPPDDACYWDMCDASLVPQASRTVEFIHRTAYDFLTDTEEGRQIRSYDLSTLGERYYQVIRGQLVATAITEEKGHLYFMLGNLARASHFIPQKMTEDLLKISWKLYNWNLIEWTPRHNGGFKQHFLALLTFPEFADFFVGSINRSPHPSILATEVLRDVVTSDRRVRSDSHISAERRSYASSILALLVSLGADWNIKGRVYDIRDLGQVNPDGSSCAIFCSALQGISSRYFQHDRGSVPLTDFYISPLVQPSPQELMNIIKRQNTTLDEPCYMSISLSQHTSFLNFGLPARFTKTEFVPKARNATRLEMPLQEAALVLEAKPCFLLEVYQRCPQFSYRGDASSSPSTLRERKLQDQSSIRIRYLLFRQTTTGFAAISESCCRLRNHESIRHMEHLIQSWLLGKIEEHPRIIVWNALMRVHDDFVAGSRAYERVFGRLMEHLADEEFGYSRITTTEMELRAQHMREEDPDAPGHWL